MDMEPDSKIQNAAKLRLIIASLTAEHFKSYELPVVAAKFGLEPGTEQEAFNSKRAYMMKRLTVLKYSELIEVAHLLSEDVSSPDLQSFLVIASPHDEMVSSALVDFDKGVIAKRWEDAVSRRSTDPEGAITLARTLLEDVLKWLLHKESVTFPESADLPQLYRLVAKELTLAPDAHTEEAFRRILGSCQTIVETLGTLRNRLSDAHSSGPLRSKPSARHAELAVNLAGTMATFLIATWDARRGD